MAAGHAEYDFNLTGDMKCNFIEALKSLGMDEEKPEQTSVRAVITHFQRGGTNQDLTEKEFIPQSGKYYSMVFCEVLIKNFHIDHVYAHWDTEYLKCLRFSVTNEMRKFAQDFFRLDKKHGGFYTAFLNAESVEIYMA